MAFPEAIKLEAKRQAHFCCVICKEPFVEVHHIIPQEDGGLDTLDNAAPLCGSCHDLFGANPIKRKQIREMRDLWWEVCKKKTSNPDTVILNEKLDQIKLRQQSQETALEEIKTTLLAFHSSTSLSIAASGNFEQISLATGLKIPNLGSCPKCGASSVVARSGRDSSGNQYRECPLCSTRY